jgi:hypothetical protein
MAKKTKLNYKKMYRINVFKKDFFVDIKKIKGKIFYKIYIPEHLSAFYISKNTLYIISEERQKDEDRWRWIKMRLESLNSTVEYLDIHSDKHQERLWNIETNFDESIKAINENFRNLNPSKYRLY